MPFGDDDLHHRTTTLVEALADRLPDIDRDRTHTALATGEWLLALDLCTALVQDRIPITERDDLAAALPIGGLGDDDLPTLRDPDYMLAALSVRTGAG